MKFFGKTSEAKPRFNWLSRKSSSGGATSKSRPNNTKMIHLGTSAKNSDGRLVGKVRIGSSAMKKLGLVAGDRIEIGVSVADRLIALRKSENGYAVSPNPSGSNPAASLMGKPVGSTVKFNDREGFSDIVGDGVTVEASDCEVDDGVILIRCPQEEVESAKKDVEQVVPPKKKTGRPRKYAPVKVEVSETESELFDLALKRAKKDGSNFESAFFKVISTDYGKELYDEVIADNESRETKT